MVSNAFTPENINLTPYLYALNRTPRLKLSSFNNELIFDKYKEVQLILLENRLVLQGFTGTDYVIIWELS